MEKSQSFSPLLLYLTPKRTARAWSRIKRGAPNECWPCTGQKLPAGYGLIGFEGKGYRVSLLLHRLIYALVNGEPPNDLLVLHSCDNPPCCNPRHLFVGTHQDNCDDKVKKGRQSKVKPNLGKRGVDHPRGRKHAALRDEAISLYSEAEGKLSMQVIASKLGVHRQSVMRWWWEYCGSKRIDPVKRTVMAPGRK